MTILADRAEGHHGLEAGASLVATVLLVVIALVYAALAATRSREPRGWNHWRTASFAVGITLLVLALRSSSSDDFGDHMLGHLLIGMFAPLALVLAAPVTLILRSVTPRTGKAMVHVLHSRPARILTNPAGLLVANLGGLALLYFTPLYTMTLSSFLLHGLVHLHFFVAGYLFAWMIAGPALARTALRCPSESSCWASQCSAIPFSPNCSTPDSSSKCRHQRSNFATPGPLCTTGAT